MTYLETLLSYHDIKRKNTSAEKPFAPSPEKQVLNTSYTLSSNCQHPVYSNTPLAMVLPSNKKNTTSGKQDGHRKAFEIYSKKQNKNTNPPVGTIRAEAFYYSPDVVSSSIRPIITVINPSPIAVSFGRADLGPDQKQSAA